MGGCLSSFECDRIMTVETAAPARPSDSTSPGVRVLPAVAGEFRDPGWLRQAIALLRKDLRAELRTKVAISSIAVFTFAALLLLALATATLREAEGMNPATGHTYPAWDPPAKMGLLWVLLCFAAFTGLAHSFVHEEEAGTATALRLSMPPGAVYAGKLALNFALIAGVTCLVTPAYIVITEMPVASPGIFAALMASGCLGLAAAATIVAALTAKVRGSGALYSALGLPILLVFLLLLQNAANTLYRLPEPMRLVRDLGGLLSYSILLIAVSALTFAFVWED